MTHGPLADLEHFPELLPIPCQHKSSALNPQNQHSVIKSNKEYSDQGGVFASIFPGGPLDLVNLKI